MANMMLFACTTTLKESKDYYPGQFPLEDVLLLDGPFKRARDLNIEVLLKFNVDCFLH
ncbi:hypothetical protein [Plebeiibacterium marinum]|uniref:Uncharacterized protein n=1 Tax=Plebeiibacterium marinum TaxID=2992111 RepID=A0AAE3SL19_9BACT|nr:hypothetical protein [Plebeiobacterium marinum]MCW3806964.1 hypothetical protein [Plebeiobacterium marinum]